MKSASYQQPSSTAALSAGQKTRALLVRLAFLAAVCIGMLALSEAMSPEVLHASDQEILVGVTAEQPLEPYRLQSNLNRMLESQGHRTWVTTDSEGFVVPASGQPLAGRRGAWHMLAVGDGLGMGVGAGRYSHSIVGQIGERLASWNVSLRNASVLGYSLVDMRRRVEAELLEEQPDEVLLVLGLTDANENKIACPSLSCGESVGSGEGSLALQMVTEELELLCRRLREERIALSLITWCPNSTTREWMQSFSRTQGVRHLELFEALRGVTQASAQAGAASEASWPLEETWVFTEKGHRLAGRTAANWLEERQAQRQAQDNGQRLGKTSTARLLR